MVESQLAQIPRASGKDAQAMSGTSSSESPAQAAPHARSTSTPAQQGPGLTAIEQLLAEEERQAAAQQAKKQKQKAKKQRQREQQQQQQQKMDEKVQQQVGEQYQQQQQLEAEHHHALRQDGHLPDKHAGEAEEQNSVHSLTDAFSNLQADETLGNRPTANVPCLPTAGIAGTAADKHGVLQDGSLPGSSSNASSLQDLFCCPLSKVMS